MLLIAAPIVAAALWMAAAMLKTLPKGPLGRAVAYARNQWAALKEYLDDGRLSISNNAAERAISLSEQLLRQWRLADVDDRTRALGEHLIGYIGVMGRQEGIDLLLEAVRCVVHDHGRRDVHFGLVGGGTSLEEMKALAARLEVADYVTFTGRVPDAELLAMLNTADVCVNPDIANDMNDKSTMNKIMEYMALGKPIVQFDLTEGRFSAREASLYARRNNALDLASKILFLLENPEKRRAMGEAGRRRVLEELEWRHEAPKLLAAYEALRAQGAARPRHAT